MRKHPIRALLLASFLAAAGLACDEPAGPQALSNPPPAFLEIPLTDVQLRVGEVTRLEADIRDTDGAPLPQSLITWTIGDVLVASIDPDGLLTAREVGFTWAHAAAGALRDSVRVSVLTDLPGG